MGTVFAHPLFLAQFETLAQQVEGIKQRDPVGYAKKNATKRLTAITKLAFDAITQAPCGRGTAEAMTVALQPIAVIHRNIASNTQALHRRR